MVEIRKKLAHVAAVWLEWRGYTREAPLRLMVRRARDNIGLDLAEHIYELRETDVIKRWRSDCESYRQVGKPKSARPHEHVHLPFACILCGLHVAYADIRAC